MKIFIDFDDTLFDSNKFKRYFENIFIEEGISRGNLRKSYDQVKEKGVYSLENHLRLLRLNFGINEKIIKEKLKVLFSDLSNCVYSDSWKILGRFPKKDLIILSFGQHSFQRKKIIGSKVTPKVFRVIITQKRKIETIHEFMKKCGYSREKIVLIDNRAEFLEKIEKADHKVLTIQMVRNNSEKIAKHADYRVKNFGEVIKILKKEEKKSSGK